MISIRPAIEVDAKELSEIQKLAFQPLYEKYHDKDNPYLRGEEDILRRLNTKAYRYYCIIDNNNTIGGILYKCSGSGVFYDDLKKGEYYLGRLYILPSFQHKGAASTAMKLCEDDIGDGVKYGVDFPVDLLKNRRCYEKACFRDTGKRFKVEDGLILACFEKERGANEKQIHPIYYDILPEALDVIQESFFAVAAEFGITRENCPNHTSFITFNDLETKMQLGWYMFGVFEGEKLVGYASLSDEGDAYELHNLAVLPEYRHKGYGKMLIDHAKEKVRELQGQKITIGIIEENKVLKNWYLENGFVHIEAKKYEHLPFTVGLMEWSCEQ